MRVLFVTGRPPWPSRRGDQARTAGLAAGLASRGHAVAVVALRPRGFAAAPPPPGVELRTVAEGRAPLLRGALGTWSVPLQVALHRQAALERAVVETVGAFRPTVVVLVLSRLAFLRRVLPSDLPVVLDLVDSLALNMRHRAERQPLLAPLWRWEGRRMAAWDRAAVEGVAAATVVAERDREALVGDGARRDRLHVLPFGVSLTAPGAKPATTSRRPAILLSGNLGYFPTVEGAGWLAREVWPGLRARRPELEWWLAGSRPAAAIRRLAALPGVRLLVEPADLGELRRQAAVAVVALRAGSGTPIKVLEAMAAGLPVVATPGAAAGLDERSGGELAVAGDAAGFAAAVEHLLDDATAAAAQAARARSWLAGRHEMGLVVERFAALLAAVSAAER